MDRISKKREDPLAAIGLLKIAAPQVLMTYYVGVPTDARCFGRYTCTYGSTTFLKTDINLEHQ